MGYWNQNAEGHSLILEDTGLVWGDAPADVMGEAIDEIIDIFKEDVKRMPTDVEIKAGLLFSLSSALANAESHLDGCGCHGDKSACRCRA